MPRKPRIEYEGAIYHVMSRGNRGESIFTDDRDCEVFVDTLEEACTKTGWLVHAFVLMGNHYHLLLETPEANLVAGMKWLQGTYTQRFNSRHKLWGHLLQGRYKALVVDGVNDYFLTVSNYVHLNPARAGMIPGHAGRELAAYRWSSFPLYLDRGKRPDWLCVDRTLGAYGLSDGQPGLIEFKVRLDRRVREIANSDNPQEVDAEWSKIRRGWCFGDTAFRNDLLERLDDVIDRKGQRASFSGDQVREHDELEADRLIEWGLGRLGIRRDELTGMRKNAPEKQVLCWLLRKRTVVTSRWITDRLGCGHPSSVSIFTGNVTSAEDGVLADLRESLKIKD